VIGTQTHRRCANPENRMSNNQGMTNVRVETLQVDRLLHKTMLK
jgi:hypothetical protein